MASLKYKIYVDRLESTELSQGDILDADKMRESLRGHQDYYAEQRHFSHYVVLTQTCDLSRGGVDFVFLAAVRALDDAIKYWQFESKKKIENNTNFVRDIFLHQYNKRGFFFLPKDIERGIVVDSVIDLRVMFSLHKTHYAAMLFARNCGMNPLYIAQLGHITGNLFSRVAMPDWEEVFDEDQDKDENNKRSVLEYATDYLGQFKAQYEDRLSTLIKEAGCKCSVQGCNKKAERFRWLPKENLYERIELEERVLCATHAENWDAYREFNGPNKAPNKAN